MRKPIEDCGNKVMWINTDHLHIPVITMSFRDRVDYISIDELESETIWCISLTEPIYINDPELLMTKEEAEEFYNIMKENWDCILFIMKEICEGCDPENCEHYKTRNIKEMPDYRLLPTRD